jgi:DNA invertase Pin-like site-specific DNA recombinase
MPGQSAESARKLRLVAYLRVSTAGQVEDGQGLDIQDKSIRSWAKEHGHRIVAIHRDEAVSGTVEERDGLEEALSAVRYNGADGLVVTSLDRLARSLTVQEAVLQQVWAADGRVFTVDSGEVLPDDPDDPVRTFVRQVLGAVGELEKGLIARRLRRGRVHKAEQGGYAYGAPGYGYRAEGGDLVPDEAEQQVIEQMRLWRDALGLSLREIAGRLDEEGVPAKRSAGWHPMKVKRVLDREKSSAGG